MRRCMEPRYVPYLRTRYNRSGNAYLPRFVVIAGYLRCACFIVFNIALVKFYNFGKYRQQKQYNWLMSY